MNENIFLHTDNSTVIILIELMSVMIFIISLCQSYTPSRPPLPYLDRPWIRLPTLLHDNTHDHNLPAFSGQ